mgnify:CR=1 FL=1
MVDAAGKEAVELIISFEWAKPLSMLRQTAAWSEAGKWEWSRENTDWKNGDYPEAVVLHGGDTEDTAITVTLDTLLPADLCGTAGCTAEHPLSRIFVMGHVHLLDHGCRSPQGAFHN